MILNRYQRNTHVYSTLDLVPGAMRLSCKVQITFTSSGESFEMARKILEAVTKPLIRFKIEADRGGQPQ